MRRITLPAFTALLLVAAVPASAKIISPPPDPAAPASALPQAGAPASPGAPAAVQPLSPYQPAPGAEDEHPVAEPRGTEDSPVVVRILPASEAAVPAAAAARERAARSSWEGWLAGFTAALLVIAIVQVVVFGLQAYRLRQTIVASRRIATRNSEDIQKFMVSMERAIGAIERSVAAASHPRNPPG